MHASNRLPQPSSASGPRVARVYHTLLAGVLAIAWLSLGSQVQVLIGSRGLLPFEPLVGALQERGAGALLRFPTWMFFGASDFVLDAGIALGLALAALALVGVATRACFLFSAVLYLGYAVAARDFLGFQWDNLLIESLVIACFLPRDRPAPFGHLLARLLLFKLYFESGIAKAQSHLGDWFDGSAMTWYYETAPLPAWPAWTAHHLPDAWHHFESYAALGLETVGAFAILGPRKARLAALVGFSGFQLVNLATANYGFFVLLALALHVFLLDERDFEPIAKATAGFRGRLCAWRPDFERWMGETFLRARRAIAVVLGLLWIATSLAAGLSQFAGTRAFDAWVDAVRPFRVANNYHLFAHITRERIEPEFQVRTGAHDAWQALVHPYKPGPVDRAPPFVWPHQPRVDFQLWFYGLSYRYAPPEYVYRLVTRLCEDPEAVASLFVTSPPSGIEAVRIAFFDTRFSSPEAKAQSGDWWRRESVGATTAFVCANARAAQPQRE